jgi:hypothetical protein
MSTLNRGAHACVVHGDTRDANANARRCASRAKASACTPASQSGQDRADAAAAWHAARVHAAATAHRWREEMGRMFQHDDQAPHA